MKSLKLTVVRFAAALAVVVSAAVAPIVVSHEAAAQTPDSLERIIREKKIKFGYIPSPPGVIRNPSTGELSGFYIDGARMIAKYMKVEPVFVETTWANFAPSLMAGQIDVSTAASFATIPRAMAVSFTVPINYLGFSAVARKGETRFKTLSDLDNADIRIAVVQGSAGHEFVIQNFPKAKVVTLSTSNLQQPFLEVSAGRADAAIQDEFQVRRYTATHPEVEASFEGSVFNTLPISWSVRNGDTNLLTFMNTAINYLLISGQWDNLAKKYGPSGRYKDAPHLTPFGQ